MTRDSRYFLAIFLAICSSSICWYWCHYQHTSRDSVSTVCGLFLKKFNFALKSISCYVHVCVCLLVPPTKLFNCFDWRPLKTADTQYSLFDRFYSTPEYIFIIEFHSLVLWVSCGRILCSQLMTSFFQKNLSTPSFFFYIIEFPAHKLISSFLTDPSTPSPFISMSSLPGSHYMSHDQLLSDRPP